MPAAHCTDRGAMGRGGIQHITYHISFPVLVRYSCVESDDSRDTRSAPEGVMWAPKRLYEGGVIDHHRPFFCWLANGRLCGIAQRVPHSLAVPGAVFWEMISAGAAGWL